MSVLPHQPSPLSIAKESLAMSEQTGDKNFQRMAIGLMAVTGLATFAHVIHEIWRDLRPKREAAKAEPAYQPPRRAEYDDEPGDHDQGRQRSWVQKSRVSERQAEGEKSWTEHSGRQRPARQH